MAELALFAGYWRFYSGTQAEQQLGGGVAEPIAQPLFDGFGQWRRRRVVAEMEVAAGQQDGDRRH